ncbi:outer membrane protein OmpA-like peptidoglycan-associated protein [Rhizobium leguminosarum]|nr:outer membrane protein OmpA-like peptidoglycan-associated protein [Rhizobium leguminosarum]MBB4343915.1 outer membrane protein OmpA-like peptidoglycan-associated protein [Rhizobium leguminosarum]MBB4355033.1 outer membrane protein OmpA-like peptidoglycan-associated protein [Rhizobium leguminosarum]MBB4387592.1 outer membrane protein OmpA-like peptidoglycan-associated protein [Rhizobium leguminosarum]MBB4464655.1 outer membrane protein OmpA-like peptidoglycan-associated protein [Rhizobium leg
MKSRLFASATFPLLSLSLALQPASAMAAVRDVATQAAAVRQVEPGSFEVAQDAPSEEELLKKKKHKEQGEAPAEQAPAAEKPAQQEAPAEKPKAERKEAPEPKAEPEAPKAEAPKEVPAEQPESKPERKAKQQAQPEAAPQQEEQPVTQEKPKKPKKQETQQAEPEAQPQPEQQPAAKEAQPETEQAQPEAKPEGGKREKGQDKAQGKDKGKGKGKAETAAPEAVTPTEEQAKPEAKPEVKPAAEAPAKQKPKGETAAPAENAPAAKTTEDKAAAPEAAPAEKPKDGTAAKPAGEQPAGAQPAAPATDTAQPQPDASGGQQVEQAIPAPEKASPEELERRKKIAADPAKSNETVVLPVENGAAVLDSDKDADRSKGREGRRDRDRQRADSQEVKVPTSDADAQAATGGQATAPVKLEAVTREKGRKLDERPQFVRPDGARFDDRGDDSRVIIQYDNRTIVRGDDDRRFLRDGERPSYEELSGDRYRETITRPEGYRIVTIRNRYGDIIQRSRVDARGREDVLYYSQDLYDDPDRDYFEDPGADLPPMRLRVPLSDYIIDTRSDPNRDYYEFLSEPPVEPVERVYSLDEVKYSARIRDKVRRIDLDTITFATGSADIPMTQARTLRKVADAISQVLEKDPSETFLIEGHTDAVGSDQSNLILSDQRAESVANVLTDVYGIAPENLATQGYGEHYLKVNTSAPEQENRRVTIRRVTALVRPVAANK